ncbi:MAG: chromosomal replication initiator protein DnaA [Armatimonadetes bacterium]|nr:chromosomal replication initiator protein DnaA [Armatimonadota bacterium]MDE2206740.1 chromosomal replication initiator protein DnaA [Armatimonadota bacterium]
MNPDAVGSDIDQSDRLLAAWGDFLELVARQVTHTSYTAWIRTAIPMSWEGSTVLLAASSPFHKTWLERRCRTKIEAVLSFCLETPNIRLEVCEPPEEVLAELRSRVPHCATAMATAPDQPILTLDVQAQEQPASRGQQAAAHRRISFCSGITPNLGYTFGGFVTGAANRMARAAALAAANRPGDGPNPIFIYGKPGLGKTHLLHAIWLHLHETRPETRVALVSGEAFVQDFVKSLGSHTEERFRNRYRQVDVWLLDDIQFLADKNRSREEFFHTFNAIYEGRRQLVFASDRTPEELSGMDDRIKTRLRAGLVVDIAPPDAAHRLAILEAWNRRNDSVIAEDALAAVAELDFASVRELEGAASKIVVWQSLYGTRVTPTQLPDILRGYNPGGAFKLPPPTLEGVVAAVAERTGITALTLRGATREATVVRVRHMAMSLAREMMPYLSTAAIGQYFNHRDHSSVLYACRRWNAARLSNPTLAACEMDLRQLFTPGG